MPAELPLLLCLLAPRGGGCVILDTFGILTQALACGMRNMSDAGKLLTFKGEYLQVHVCCYPDIPRLGFCWPLSCLLCSANLSRPATTRTVGRWSAPPGLYMYAVNRSQVPQLTKQGCPWCRSFKYHSVCI